MIRTTTLRLRTIRWKGKNRNANKFFELDEPSQKFLMSPFLTEHGACDFYTFCGITALEYEGDDCV